MSDLAIFLAGVTQRYLRQQYGGSDKYLRYLLYRCYTIGVRDGSNRVQVSIFDANCKKQLTNHYSDTVIFKSTMFFA